MGDETIHKPQGESRKNLVTHLCQIEPPPPPKDRNNKTYDPFDVILKKGDLVKFWNNEMPR